MIVELLDLVDLEEGAEAARGGRGIGGVLPGEDDIGGGEGAAVLPCHAALEVPGGPGAVSGEPPVLGRRDGGGEFGSRFRRGRIRASGSYKMRDVWSSMMVAARCGFNSVGAAQ